jgi:S-formylglutathione hydrolase FrmB
VVAVPLCVANAGLALNAWVGYFPTVHAAWNQLTAGPLPNQTDRVTVTAMQLKGIRPTKGVVVPINIPGDASQFHHRRELVYLPPAWFNTDPAPRLPAVMMIGAAMNTPADWLRAGNALATVDGFASAHGGNSPVLVFADVTGAFNNDTECVNGSRGNAADHLTKDVVPYMVSNFRVSAQRSNWGILGWSMGGTCAVELTSRRPDVFSAFVDIAGDAAPNVGSKAQTISTLFGGNPDAYAAFDPTTIIARHGRYSGVAGWFDIPGPATRGAPTGPDLANPEGQDAAADALCRLAKGHGIRCAVVAQPGRHDWPFAAQAFGVTLPWLAGRLGTPDVARASLPGLAPETVPTAEVTSATAAGRAGG